MSERIADSQMEAQRFFEAGDVEVTALARVVWGMNGETQVGTHNEHRHVEAQTHTSTQSQLVKEILHLQLPARAILVVLEQPDVAGIKENSAIEVTQNREAELGIGLELEGTCLVIVIVATAVGRMVSARAD